MVCIDIAYRSTTETGECYHTDTYYVPRWRGTFNGKEMTWDGVSMSYKKDCPKVGFKTTLMVNPQNPRQYYDKKYGAGAFNKSGTLLGLFLCAFAIAMTMSI